MGIKYAEDQFNMGMFFCLKIGLFPDLLHTHPARHIILKSPPPPTHTHWGPTLGKPGVTLKVGNHLTGLPDDEPLTTSTFNSPDFDV